MQSNQIDILTMIDPLEQKRKLLFVDTCKLMKRLKDEGKTPQAIEQIIRLISLPLDMHIAVMGRFTEICKYGRILTPSERKILS